MTPVEEAIIETLRRSGPCRLDDIATHLSPSYSWGDVFVAVDRMSRNGGLFLHNSVTRPIRSLSGRGLGIPVCHRAKRSRNQAHDRISFLYYPKGGPYHDDEPSGCHTSELETAGGSITM
jgi:hypothetical protein